MNKKLTFNYESSSLILHVWEDGEEGHCATISDLYSQMRSHGHASALMEKTLFYTDKAGLSVYLEIKQFGHPIGLSNEDLRKFYEKFGFVKHDETRWVHRAPSQDLQGI